MAPSTAANTGAVQPFIKLPHPYLTPYALEKSSRDHDGVATTFLQLKQLPLSASDSKEQPNLLPLAEPLHNDILYFTEPTDLKSSERPPESNNTAWGRARRSPCSQWVWGDDDNNNKSESNHNPPTLGQAWLAIYSLFTLRPSMEAFRLSLRGPGSSGLASQLKTVLLAVPHPISSGFPFDEELLIPRDTFWQGAGSPFGPRTAWMPESAQSFSPPAAAEPSTTTASSSSHHHLPKPLSHYPLTPQLHTMTSDPSAGVLTWHPTRPAKPSPGSVVYSRWIPHLRETFSMISLDYRDPQHLDLFHEWQNDPRVSQGWNETGTLSQHREYLRKADQDPHQITLLARFEGVPFAYFEVYWAKEDRLGGYYQAQDWDRGRHSLVGDVRFRGPHRVSAWWSSLMHYLFLDDARTTQVVGEPKYTNSSVLGYDFVHGFGLSKFVDLPHKRSAFMTCSRERFFQLSPLVGENEKVVGGTMVGVVPKL